MRASERKKKKKKRRAKERVRKREKEIERRGGGGENENRHDLDDAFYGIVRNRSRKVVRELTNHGRLFFDRGENNRL